MNVLKLAIAAGMIAISATYAEDETLNIYGAVGAGFGMGGELYTSYDRSTNATTATDVKDRFFNYGSGVKFDLGCQYFMMENVSLQGSFAYSAGLPFKIQQINGSTKTETTFKRHLFGIKVSVVPRFEVLELIDLYTGVGLGFFWNTRPFKILIETPLGSQEATGKITSHPALGFVGQLGADYPLTDKFKLFGEFAFEQIEFNLSKYITKKTTIIGTTTGTQYYSKDDNNPQNLDPEKVSGSSFQIRVGVRYALM